MQLAILDRLGVGVVLLDREYRITGWNTFMADHSGKAFATVQGESILMLPLVTDPDGLKAYVDGVFAGLKTLHLSWEQAGTMFNLHFINPEDQTQREMMQDITLSPVTNHDGEVEGVCITVVDSTDSHLYQMMLQEALREVEENSRRDAMTGLYGRQYFMEQAKKEFSRAKRYNTSFSILLIDLDHFKNINDTYGHLAGDEVLQSFAERMSATLRNVDLAGRYGGEEFVLLLPSTDLEGAATVAERIRAVAADYKVPTSSGELPISCSVGVAQFSQTDSDLNGLLERADKALYVAKNEGRNQVKLSQI